MKVRHKSSIVVTGKCWAYGGKVYFDPRFGTYLQFAIEIPEHRSFGFSRYSSRVYVQWYKGSWLPKKGEWLQCTGYTGGAAIKESIDKGPVANLVLMCFGKDVVRLDPDT